MNSIYIRLVSSYRLFSALLNWFKVVRGPFALFTRFLPRPVRKESNAPMLKTRIKKSMYILVVCGLTFLKIYFAHMGNKDRCKSVLFYSSNFKSHTIELLRKPILSSFIKFIKSILFLYLDTYLVL